MAGQTIPNPVRVRLSVPFPSLMLLRYFGCKIADRPTDRDRSFVIIWCSPSSSSTSISGTRPTQCCPTFVVLLLYGSIGLDDETIAPRPRICDYTILNINIGEAIAALWYLKNEISSKIYICSDLLTPARLRQKSSALLLHLEKIKDDIILRCREEMSM